MPVGHATAIYKRRHPHPLPFDSSALQQSLLLVVNDGLYHRFKFLLPYRLASTDPACGCQEGFLLTLDTPRGDLVLRYIVRVALDSDP